MRIKLVMMLMMSMFLISFASAASFDNLIVEADSNFDGTPTGAYVPIEVKNAFGLGSVVLSAYIKSNDEYCGTSCSSTIKMELNSELSLIDDIEFERLEDGVWESYNLKDYKFAVRGDNLFAGVSTWESYKLKDDVLAGTYEVRLDAAKEFTESIRWKIKTNGDWANEWDVSWKADTYDDCSETSDMIICESENTGGKILEVVEQRVMKDGKWEKPEKKVKAVSGGYFFETGAYNVVVDTQKKQMDINAGGDTFSVKIEKDVKSFGDDYIIFDLSTNKMDAELKYTFTDEDITKLITIYSMDENEKKVKFSYPELFDRGVDTGKIKVDTEVIFWDSGDGIKYSKGIVKDNTQTKLELDSEYLETAAFPVYLDPSLEITTGTELCGDQEWDSVTISNSATLSVCAYNGTTGTGTINFTVLGAFTIEAGAKINGVSKGYEGGASLTTTPPNAGIAGQGPGAGTAGNSNDGSCKAANGGGAGSLGGVGGYGGYSGCLSLTRGYGGPTYGNNSDLTEFLIGSGGASGAGYRSGGYSGAGGRGAGALRIKAGSIDLQGTLDFEGSNGGGGSWEGNAGGGAGSGGTILLISGTMNLTSATIDVSGGNGGTGIGNNNDQGGGGGGGGGGMVKFHYGTTFINDSMTLLDAQGGPKGSQYKPMTALPEAGYDGTVYYELGSFDDFYVTMNTPTEGEILSSSLVPFNASTTTIGIDIIENMTLWTNETGSFVAQNSTTGINASAYDEIWYRTMPDGFYAWYATACNTDGDCKTAAPTVAFSVDTTAPAITLSAPPAITTFGTAALPLNLNWTVSDINLDSCWYDYNGTNVPVNCSLNTTIFYTDDVINRNITFYANDTVGNINSDSRSWDYTLTSSGEVYNPTTTETSSEFFSINISYNSAIWSAASMDFHYDGLNYDATMSGTGDDIYASYTLDIPEVPAQEVNDFYWILSLTNVNGTTEYYTTTRQQTVSKVNFTLCDLVDDPQLYFETYSTTDPTTAVNATFASSWTIRDSSGSTVALSETFEDMTETNSTWGFCLTPNSSEYTVSVSITVDATDYTPTSHYIVEADYTGVGDPIPLYLLSDNDSTLTQIIVRNQDNQPVEDVYTTIQRYDLGTDTYYNVAMIKSDSDGSDLAYLKWYDTWYRFIGVLDGTVVFTEGAEKISASPKIITYGEVAGSDYEKFRNIEYSLTYNDVTENFVLSFVDPTGEVSSSCLRVLKRNVTADYTICETCETSNSATMYCNIATAGNGTFIADYYATGSPRYWIDQLLEIKNSQNEFYDLIGNDNGTGLAIIIAGIVMTLFLITPALGVLGAILGMILAVALGFQPMDYTAMAGIIVVGLAVMWAVQK